MLIEFKVGNFRSFDSVQTLSMVAADSHNLRKIAVQTEADLPLLKVSGIYGANASGKSNLFTALKFLRTLVISSFQNSDPLSKINVQRFALKKQSLKDVPAIFEVSFTAGSKGNVKIYTYHVELVPERIQKEQLQIDGEETFLRNGQNFDVDESQVPESATKQQLTKPNTLFISVLAATNTQVGLDVMSFFRNEIVPVNGLENKIEPATKEMLESTDKILLLKRLHEADLTINDVNVEHNQFSILDEDNNKVDLQKLPPRLRNQVLSQSTRIKSTHNVYDDEGKVVGKHDFDMETDESKGTQIFLNVLGPILSALEQGKIVLADEFGTAMHPLMAAYLIKLFQNEQNTNSAQLIFNTQDVSTMDHKTLRTDQIWFAEKDRQEATRLLSLSDYRRNGKPIRSDLVYNRQYLRGSFGAIPIIRKHPVGEGDE
ncbi:AAA family ATPase [Lacticaseibacillus zhaodongensis]|uniref:AAA family ATPase n=1 Tax=Lacticaseibacillus zhaodongensis TaxID=2668065 RepID=UPI0012D339C3|nr:ATP-binding protein [Lacticaseibacillus zhaodongensis]